MATPSKLYSGCSLLMGFLFAYSTAVQFNDPDWYLWVPLYGCACAVNLLKWYVSIEAMKHVAKATMGFGICLWVKVVAEDYMNGIAGFLSLDLSERVVREKTGSGLVVCSMILHLIAASSSSSSSTRIHRTSKSKREFPRYLTYGMAWLVAFSYGLPIFFLVQKGKMKF
ncbi:transmembrane protein 220 isoform X2 [Benincasa hispida]|uniref:transmembrane protein 220 isoform X2 n=1 Tax=Benincasa hispida TaxID=102211 RepID=UPI0019025F03|nr:transmembrane protein 220 isoform X2 [Benincasa hispida]